MICLSALLAPITDVEYQRGTRAKSESKVEPSAAEQARFKHELRGDHRGDTRRYHPVCCLSLLSAVCCLLSTVSVCSSLQSSSSFLLALDWPRLETLPFSPCSPHSCSIRIGDLSTLQSAKGDRGRRQFHFCFHSIHTHKTTHPPPRELLCNPTGASERADPPSPRLIISVTTSLSLVFCHLLGCSGCSK